MNAKGWLLSALLCAAVFLPALGARTIAARRWLLGVGVVVAVAIGALAVWAATQPGEGFFPSAAGYAFLLVAIPLGAGVGAAGLVLLATRRTRMADTQRAILAAAALLAISGFLIWRLYT